MLQLDGTTAHNSIGLIFIFSVRKVFLKCLYAPSIYEKMWTNGGWCILLDDEIFYISLNSDVIKDSDHDSDFLWEPSEDKSCHDNSSTHALMFQGFSHEKKNEYLISTSGSKL